MRNSFNVLANNDKSTIKHLKNLSKIAGYHNFNEANKPKQKNNLFKKAFVKVFLAHGSYNSIAKRLKTNPETIKAHESEPTNDKLRWVIMGFNDYIKRHNLIIEELRKIAYFFRES